MDTSRAYYCFKGFEFERRMLQSNHNEINYIDLGAGQKTGTRRISEIARSTLSSKKQGRLLFNLVNWYKPKKTLELGTSLGLGTMYLAAAHSKNQVHTIEGNPSSTDLAKNLFLRYKLQNIITHVGSFDQLLPDLLKEEGPWDLLFNDGNHKSEAMLRYFDWCYPYLSNDAIVVFDDIYWSSDMARGWEAIQSDDRVSLTINLFDVGIAFMDKQLPKKHLTLIDSQAKPWQSGFLR